MIRPVTLVIPVLNENNSLDELFASLAAQIEKPAEIIFVDAGSIDGSPEKIETWWKTRGWPGTQTRVLKTPGTYPGASRNAGVKAATQEWIAFLDAGLTAEPDWLRVLWEETQNVPSDHAFGFCRFEARGYLAESLCFLSTGLGNARAVLPASIFHKKVFEEIGYLPEHLRAAEDLVWIGELIQHKGRRHFCPQALVRYAHYPRTLGAALQKWHVYARHMALAGVKPSQRFGYPLFFAALIFMIFKYPAWGLGALAAYAVLRGLVLPLKNTDPRERRRSLRLWPAAPALALLLDLAKTAGFLRSAPLKTTSE